MLPAVILFTLPSLASTDSKLPRVLAICRSLDRQRFHPCVSVDHSGRLDPRGKRLLAELGVPTFQIRMSPHRREFIRSLYEMIGTPRTLQRASVLIQHSSDYSSSWTEPVLARLAGVKYWISTKTNMQCKGWHWQLRLRLSDRIIVQSPEIATLLTHEIPSIGRRVILIPNGVDTDIFRPGSRDETLAGEWAIGSDDIVLGCVAHLTPVKDHPTLLQALKLCRYRNIKLLLIGADIDAKYAGEVRRLVIELGLKNRVHFLGRRSDVSRLHRVMDGIILMSKEESLSNAVLEGMASGLPVISSDCGGMRDAVLDGVNGWLIPRGEDYLVRLSSAMDEWASDAERRQAFGNASRRIVDERFSLSQMVNSHIRLYESFLDLVQ